ncbi:hypothetical protein [Streptomyces melanosporofaciens]|nr:hypothetical protein [Streptomyces melanosporofaciens]
MVFASLSDAASLAPALLALVVTPETVTARRRPTVSVRRPTVPGRPAARAEFLRAATAVLAAFAVSGLFSSLVPSFLRERLHVHNLAAVGAEVGLLFLIALAAQWPPRHGGSPGAGRHRRSSWRAARCSRPGCGHGHW